MTEPLDRIFLIDGAALAYRSYFAMIRNPLINSKGENTSAVFGFVNALLNLRDAEEPTAVVVAFDTPHPTFRHEKYPAYKATREKMPEDLASQLPVLKEFTQAMGLPLIEMPGFEADDIIGTLARQADEAGATAYIVSGDKDFAQLVNERILLYKPGRQREPAVVMDREAVRDKFGVPPELMIDYLALMGDSSDNVPGVPRVGKKTALKLIEQFGSLDAVLERTEEVKGKAVKKSLQENRELALLSRDLVTIRTDLEVDLGPEGMLARPTDSARLKELILRLEFRSMIDRVAGLSVADATNDEHRWHALTTPLELRALAGRLKDAGEFVFDTETTSLDPLSADLVGLSFAVEPREAWYVPVRPPSPDGVHPEEVVAVLGPVLEDGSLGKIGQNIKYDLLVLARAGIELAGVRDDTMVASHVLNPGRQSHGIDALALEFLNYRKIATSEVIGTGKRARPMSEIPVADVSRYACEDADITCRLREALLPGVTDSGLERLYRDVEIPLIPVLAAMERRGIKLDTGFLGELSTELSRRIEEIGKRVYELAGTELNINSSQQVAELLYETLEVHTRLGAKLRKTRGGTGYTTDQMALEALATVEIDPELPEDEAAERERLRKLPRAILDYREVQKLRSTYVDALPELLGADGRLHTSFKQTGTATGRLSSANPNLQNIPVRTELGRRIRQAFVPGEPGWLMLSADYSQIELRIIAHLSGDPELIDAFRKGEDIHSRTAGRIFGIAADEVTREQRGIAKSINFGIIYGMGPQRLSQQTGISHGEAASFIKAYFESYPVVKEYLKQAVTEARRTGYVETLMGRRRYLPEINSRDGRTRSNAEHIAVNTPVQGSAADLIKMAMIRVEERMAKEGLRAGMLLQVHDELVFEVPPEEVEQVTRLAREEMAAPMDLSVSVVVDVGVGSNWAEAH